MTRLKKKKSICHGSVLSSGQSNTVILYEERRGRDKNRKKKKSFRRLWALPSAEVKNYVTVLI